jgi:alpha-galactosidase
LLTLAVALLFRSSPSAEAVEIRTPAESPAPRINGPGVFGVRPQSPFLYTIPATGVRPMEFSVDDLPKGLAVDPATGCITGSLKKTGEFRVVLRAKNAHGISNKPFRIVVGEKISLTPAMGWSSWNCWGESVDQQKVLRSARAMASSGLINHGWTYINIDDTWQGQRTGKEHALQANKKFPDLKGLCDTIHRLGLKAGIYSTPWVAAYSKYPGGSSDNPRGSWTNTMATLENHRFGKYTFERADAGQWAAWGFDYLKYDWFPNDVPHTAAMSKALRKSGRDIIFSLSNAAPIDHAADWARLANSWRTTSDIWDRWSKCDQFWQYGVSEIGFAQDGWSQYAGPGHWNDPDMLVVGRVGFGELFFTPSLTSDQLHPTNLTPDEQYSHITLWCLLSAPLLLGCDLERLDPFTLNLLSNDEVLALDQDALGKQATRVATSGPVDVYLKVLEDGSKALGFFNRDSSGQTIGFDKLKYLGFVSKQHVRDLWRQQNLRDIDIDNNDKLTMTIPPHGVQLYQLKEASQ